MHAAFVLEHLSTGLTNKLNMYWPVKLLDNNQTYFHLHLANVMSVLFVVPVAAVNMVVTVDSYLKRDSAILAVEKSCLV